MFDVVFFPACEAFMRSALKGIARMGMAFLSCARGINMLVNSKMEDLTDMGPWRIIMEENMRGDGKKASTADRAL